MRMDHKSETILLVDDRPANLVALEAVLAPLGRRLVKATSGREALRFLLHDECALILLDVQMPDLDGFETAALIRQRQRSRDTPIIFVTAVHDEEEQVTRGYSLGAVDYIVKPFNADELVTKVRNFLEQQGLKPNAALLREPVALPYEPRRGSGPPGYRLAQAGGGPEWTERRISVGSRDDRRRRDDFAIGRAALSNRSADAYARRR
jgi:DNA-binding response OmpR family regulator